MKNVFKRLVVALFVIIVFCCIMEVSSFTMPTIAYAEEISLSIDDYTDSDSLIKADGTLSDQTIRSFAKEVKNAKANTSFPELTEVIPRQYLESQKENATFAYNGKEYGFYVVKEGNYFDVLLIDFKYKFDNGRESDIEYKIRIEPILQQSFYRAQTSSGDYEWRKYIGSGERYAYYVANPRFISIVQNENALNYGDNGYSKLNDEGVIILQSRANYGKISYKTETDYLGSVLNFACKQVLDKYIDKTMGGVASTIMDILEFNANLYQESKEVILETNNEKNIFTRQSKTAQRDSKEIDGYSRVAGFMPTEEIVLSADVDSYAEFITVLSDANYRTRLSEFCDFDIVKRIPNSYSSMEYVTGAGDNEAFSFNKVNVLYNDKTVTELDSSAITQKSLAYFLQIGTHKFSYNCTDTTNYQMVFDTSLPDIEVYCGEDKIQTNKNNNIVEVKLEKGNNYSFIFSQANEQYYYFTFCKKIENITSFGDLNITLSEKYESKWYKYIPQDNIYISIEYDESKFYLGVFCDGRNDTELNGVQDQIEFYAERDTIYYIRLSNATENEISNTWSFNEVKELPCNDTSDSFAVNEKRVFKFVAPVEGSYAVTGLPSGLTATFNAPYDGNNYVLPAGVNYVTIKGNSARATCSIGFVSQTVTVGDEITISGKTKSAFVKFIPLQTLNYSLKLPTSVKLEQIICGDIVDNTNTTSNIKLNANTTYYFRVSAYGNNNLPDSFKVSIKPQIITSITVDEDRGVGNGTVTGNGTQVVEIIINEINIYSFNGISNYTLCDQYLQTVGSDSVLFAGKYYLKADFIEGETYNLTISKTGLDMQIGDVIGITGTVTYKYELEIGKKYEIRIGASADHAFTATTTLKNSLGETCAVTKTEDYYTFTANDTIIFVNLTMHNIVGQAGIFTLLETNSTSSAFIQIIMPDHIYPLATNKSQCIIKIPSGKYTLYIQKKVGETVRLYELNGNTTREFNGVMVNGTTLQNSTAINYSLSYTTEKVFILYSDNNEVDCLLSYADNNSKYIIGVKNQSPQKSELSIYNNYEFVLYRYTDGTQYLVSDITNEEFTVYQGSQNGTVISSNDGVYIFNNTNNVYVTIDFFGIKALTEYVVVKPQVEGSYEVTESGLCFKPLPLNYSSNEYTFDKIILELICNNRKQFSNEYSYVIPSIDITNYVWNKTLCMKIIFIYSNDNNYVEFIGEFNYSVPTYNINSIIDLGSNDILIIEAEESCTVNRTITIPDTMKHIFFLGGDVKIKNLNIIVSTRSSILKMYMKNFNYTFYENGLWVDGYSTLDLNIESECSIMPNTDKAMGSASKTAGRGVSGYEINIVGTGKLTVKSGKKQSNSVVMMTEGLPGISANKLTVSVNTLHVIGGAGGDSSNAEGTEYPLNDLKGKSANTGGVGGYAIYATTELNVTTSCKTLILDGGDGGNGGNGADGLNGTTNFEAGGRGGDGGHGGTGVNDTELNAKPSAGGNGGNGGHGGYSYSTSLYEKPGDGGNGGNGGDPGNVGHGLAGGNGGYGYNGGNGGNGSNPKIVFSKGGNAGNGGDAYGGQVGGAGSPGKGKLHSDGAKGSKGTSYSDYQDYPWDS